MVMAEIYTHCGRYDDALDELEYLLSLETDYTANDVRLNPTFDRIRHLPRYRELMNRYALNRGV